MTNSVASLRGSAFVAGIVFAVSCHAGAGDPDPSFGSGGKVTTDMGQRVSGSMTRNSMAIQADGKIVIVRDPGFSVFRYKLDGTLDESFGEEGRAFADFYPYGGPSWGTAVATQADGKTLVGGTTFGSGSTRYDFALLRLDATGNLDAGFGVDGRVVSDFGDLWEFTGSASEEQLRAIVALPDGGILALGTAGSRNLVLARYRHDGALDRAFGTRGATIVDTGGIRDLNLAVLPDSGKILVSGVSVAGNSFLVRIHPTGALDETFGAGGIIVYPYPDVSRVAALAVQPDGKILLAGTDLGGFVLHRFLADGTPDASFGTAGKVLTDFGTQSGRFAALSTLAVHADGRIVASGFQRTWVSSAINYFDFATARYNTDGSLDTTFADGGKAITEFEFRHASAVAAAVLWGGKLVLAGVALYGVLGEPVTQIISTPNLISGHIALARYEADGSLDGTFGVAGTVITPQESRHSDDNARGVAIQADGKIIVAASTFGELKQDFGVVRYNVDGTLDASFGNQGRVTTDFSLDIPPTGCRNWLGLRVAADFPRALAVQQDGKILVAGQSDCDDGAHVAFALARYMPDGSLDTAFGTGGKVVTDFGTRHIAGAEAIALQPDGKLVVAGYSRTKTSGPPFEFALARYNPDGSLDATFGNTGQVTTDVTTNNDYGRAIALQEDGRIVVLGYYLTPATETALVRYNADGSVDTSFGVNGRVSGSLGTAHFVGKSLALQSDGKIVIAGTAGSTSWPYNFELRRLNADGSLDTTFGVAGVVSTDFGSSADLANRVVAQPDGRLIAVGQRNFFLHTHGAPWIGSLATDFALARYNADGSLDYTFGDGGRVTTDFGASVSGSNELNEAAYAVVLQPDGKIVVAGDTARFLGIDWGAFPAAHYDIAVARYEGVTTRSDVLEGLVFTIEDLAALGVLNHGHATALQAPLQAAVLQVGRGNNTAAVNQLSAFLGMVDTFERKGTLSTQQRNVLYDTVADVVGALSN